jgi:hypothetical protein
MSRQFDSANENPAGGKSRSTGRARCSPRTSISLAACSDRRWCIARWLAGGAYASNRARSWCGRFNWWPAGAARSPRLESKRLSLLWPPRLPSSLRAIRAPPHGLQFLLGTDRTEPLRLQPEFSSPVSGRAHGRSFSPGGVREQRGQYSGWQSRGDEWGACPALGSSTGEKHQEPVAPCPNRPRGPVAAGVMVI